MYNLETDKSNKNIEARLRNINGYIEEELRKLHPGMNHTIFKVYYLENLHILMKE